MSSTLKATNWKGVRQKISREHYDNAKETLGVTGTFWESTITKRKANQEGNQFWGSYSWR